MGAVFSRNNKKAHADMARKLHNAFSQQRYDDAVAMAASDVEIVSYSTGYRSTGTEGFRTFTAGFSKAFPDMSIMHRNILVDGDQVVVEFEAKGTHTGPLTTPNGEVPATGKNVKLNVVEIQTWKKGKMTRLVNYQDSMDMMRQLELLPAPEEQAK